MFIYIFEITKYVFKNLSRLNFYNSNYLTRESNKLIQIRQHIYNAYKDSKHSMCCKIYNSLPSQITQINSSSALNSLKRKLIEK